MTLLVGSVLSLAGFDFPDFTLVAKPTQSYYNATGGFVANGEIRIPASSGNISFNLSETETVGVPVAFRAHYTSGGVYNQISYYPVVIPNEEEINLSDLLVVVLPQS